MIGKQVVLEALVAGTLIGVAFAQAPTSPSVEATSPAGRVVIKVGETQVTQAEFEARIGDFEKQGEGEGASEKKRRDLGDDYASVLLLSQLAVANHLDSSPEISRQLAVARMQVLSDAEFASLMRQADPTTEEISKYYSDHLSDYDQVQIRRLFIWKRHGNSKDGQVLTAQAASARADQIRQAYASGVDVKKLSDDLRKSGDGMLDPEPLAFSRGELSPNIEKVAFALKESEWSDVEDTPAAVLFMQLVKRDRRQLGQVSSSIEKELQGQRMQATLDDLKKKAGIWMDKEYFGNASAPASAAKMPTSARPTLQEPENQQEKQK